MNKDTQRKMLQTKYLFTLQHDETGRTTEQVFSLKEIYNGDAKGFVNDTPRYYLVDIRQINHMNEPTPETHPSLEPPTYRADNN